MRLFRQQTEGDWSYVVEEIIQALKSRIKDPSALVREHVAWALQQHHIAV
jgi:epoxyqueuosine reductase QueG